MADEYDGRVVIGTELDNSGFEKGSEKLKSAVSGLTDALESMSGNAQRAFGKRWKMPEPDLPAFDDNGLEDAIAEFEAHERELAERSKQILDDVDASNLVEQYEDAEKAAERLAERQRMLRERMEEREADAFSDSHAATDKTFAKYARTIKSNADAIFHALRRLQHTSEQGFRNTSQVLTFSSGIDEAERRIASLKEEMRELGEYQLLDEKQQKNYEDIRKEIQQMEDALRISSGLIRQEEIDAARLNVQIAQQKVSESDNIIARRQAMRELAKAQNELAVISQRSVTPAPDAEANSKWLLLRGTLDLVGVTIRGLGSAARYAGETMFRHLPDSVQDSVSTVRDRFSELSSELHEKASEIAETVKRPFAGLAERVEPVFSRIADATEPARKAIRDIAAGLRDVLKTAVSFTSRIGSGLFKGMTNGIKSLTKGVKAAGNGIKSLLSNFSKKGTSGVDGLFKKFTGLKNMLASRIKRTFISFLFEQVKESFNELAKFDARFDKSVSNLRNRTSELGANIMASLGGIIRQIEPIITKAVDAASAAVTKINAVMSAIRGEATMQIAVRRTESYADSLRDAAKGAKEAQKAQEKLNATLTSIDEIHKLDAPKEETQIDTDAGADAEKAFYENVPVDSILGKMGDFGRKIADQIVQGIRSGDWRAAGTAISEGLNSVVQKIDDGIWRARDKVLQKAHDITELLNGMVDGFDARALGTTIGDGINLALDTAYTFLETFDWSKFGQRTVEGLNGLVDRLDPKKIGRTIGSTLNAAIDWAYEVFSGFEWDKAGAKLAQSLNEFVKNVKWDKAAKTVSAAISGAINSVASFLETADWKEIGQAIIDFFKNIDYGSIVSAIVRAIGAAIGGVAALMKKIFEAIMDTGEAWGARLFEKYGDEFDAAGGSIADGILAGIKAIFKDVASWCKKNIVDPFVKSFKKAFGISSPSREMKPYGGYVGEGILEGIAGIFSDITNWIKTNIVEPFRRGFSTAFSVVGDKANALFENGKSIANGIKGGITAGWSAISTLIKGKKDDLKKDSAELADNAVSGFSDTSKFTKAGQKVVDGVSAGLSSGNLQEAGGNIMESLGRGIDENYDEKVGRIVTQRTKQIGDTILNPTVADFSWAGEQIDYRVGDGVWTGYDKYIKENISIRARDIADGFASGDYFGAGQSAAEEFYRGMWNNLAQGGTNSIADIVAAAKESSRGYQGAAIRTAQSLASVATAAKELDGTEVEISVDGAASVLDKVADKLAGIARTFDAIGKAFSDMTTLPVPAYATGAFAPAQTRVTDSTAQSDRVTATLIERLIGRIEELEETVANRPIRVESKVVLDQREIGRATTEYNSNNNRVTNGNGGVGW